MSTGLGTPQGVRTIRTIPHGQYTVLILAPLLHHGRPSTADFTRIKRYIFEEPTWPWVSAFANFSANRFVQSLYDGWSGFRNEARGVYYAHAQKDLEILTRWATILAVVNGTDSQLAAGLQGQLFINAAEILRYLGPMNTTDYVSIAAMFFRAVAPALVPVEQASYGVAGRSSMVGEYGQGEIASY
ncbi:uncharacterized protein EV420DRAFT_1649810 [Desarmillaria tabescens]|uniref:Uncharacterized protein n=1 Tax=Armillaria tabescens TaxID=1929756 RepID=A0AA39JHE4_ARMTA|nr:uncharacterized protein EV420DRAFT_1649810 [Desarmillaria tabescens]KAK0442005.1 hypothetical protein EV420DRAFT_1649810 [Desarmillaria tabescens]